VSEPSISTTPAESGQPVALTVVPEPASGVGPNPPHGGDPFQLGKQEKAENGEWCKARFATNPDEFWDNRLNKKNPKGPDIKHKDTGNAAWL
jgi:hypothetical protein